MHVIKILFGILEFLGICPNSQDKSKWKRIWFNSRIYITFIISEWFVVLATWDIINTIRKSTIPTDRISEMLITFLAGFKILSLYSNRNIIFDLLGRILNTADRYRCELKKTFI